MLRNLVTEGQILLFGPMWGGGGGGGRGGGGVVSGGDGHTCLLELSHVGIDQRQASLAVLPPLKSSRILVPSHFLASDAVLCKYLVAVLLSEEPACRQCGNWLLEGGQELGVGRELVRHGEGPKTNRVFGFCQKTVSASCTLQDTLQDFCREKDTVKRRHRLLEIALFLLRRIDNSKEKQRSSHIDTVRQ